MDKFINIFSIFYVLGGFGFLIHEVISYLIFQPPAYKMLDRGIVAFIIALVLGLPLIFYFATVQQREKERELESRIIKQVFEKLK